MMNVTIKMMPESDSTLAINAVSEGRATWHVLAEAGQASALKAGPASLRAVADVFDLVDGMRLLAVKRLRVTFSGSSSRCDRHGRLSLARLLASSGQTRRSGVSGLLA